MLLLRETTFILLTTLIVVVNSKAPYEGLEKFSEKYVFPELEYGYTDLEPYIDEATLRVHHGGHHKGYMKKINAKLEEWREEASDGLSSASLVDIITSIDDVPIKYQKAVEDFGGGFLNHALYFAVMSPNEANETRLPTDALLGDINDSFGSFQQFKDQFTAEALKLFGSGYVWLNQELSSGGRFLLSITTTANQESPLSDGLQPILTLDVWEHAYYLKHQLRRPKHVEDWWKVVDWTQVKKLSDWWQQPSKHEEL
uniref:Superoxide dismutase n=1 Tax=Paelopatides sp. YL-2018 TaxID=2219783 RepID=A0A411L1L4_9ECHN|nr:manganese superoxide dismutase [Paelopatides sp. YL-2018]